jgi:AraC family transcriptional regulator, transcriptional activator FtrA
MTQVTLLAYANVDDLDFFGAMSVLAKAGASLGADFFKVGAHTRIVKLSSGVEVDLGDRWLPLRSAMPARGLLVPGGPGALAAAEELELTTLLRAARAGGVRFYVCCTGACILGAIGLLEGMSVAMHHLKRAALEKSGCSAIVEGLVRDRWLTSVAGDPSPSVKSVDLATQLIRDLAPEALPPILERMELEHGRRVREHVAPTT